MPDQPEIVIVWGTGAKFRQLRSVCTDLRIDFLVDNDPARQGGSVNGLEVRSPECLRALDPDRLLVIVASSYVMEIFQQLESMGFRLGKHFLYANRFMEFGLSNLDDVEEDYLQTHLCLEPFRDFLFHETGDVYTCCQAYQDIPIGNLFRQPWEEIWMSPRAVQFRESLMGGGYEYCSRKCPFIVSRRLVPKTAALKASMSSTSTFDYPRKIVLGCDETCNLSCPSCRTHVVVNKSEHHQKVFRALDEKIRPLLAKADILDGLCSGEFLFSPSVSSFMKTLSKEAFPNLRLWLTTNGQLMDPVRWESYANLKGVLERLSVSLDAASQETYEKLRRGGKWEIVCKNLEFIAYLRRTAAIKELVFRFVVQRDNFMEMVRFVEFAKGHGVDRIVFSGIVNWGAMTASEFEALDVTNENHPSYPTLMEILRDPIFRGESPAIDVDNMGGLFKAAAPLAPSEG